MSHPGFFHFFRRLTILTFLCCVFFPGKRVIAQTPVPAPPAQDTPAQADASSKPAQSPPSSDNQEVSSQDTPTTFKVRVNLVLVRVVVRDASGKVVSGLKKEDFQLFDNRKPQTISSFSLETPETRAASAVTSPGAAAYSSSADPIAGKAIVLPQRFVSMVFDDVHLSMEDATFVRDSATRFFGSLAPSDRVSMNTTSGQFTQEFTDDHEALKRALFGIIPRPLGAVGFHDCPDVSYYQADLIVNKSDAQALDVATEDAVQCAFNGDEQMRVQAQSLAKAAAFRGLEAGDAASEYAYRHLEDIVRRLA